MFLDLNRCFLPIKDGDEAGLELGRRWGLKSGHWLTWPTLLTHRRVVLLAEADCGKTQEFRHQTEQLLGKGEAAFFARIEDLQEGIAGALEIGKPDALVQWRRGDAAGYFFLDSVDEARLLNPRQLDKGLRRFAADLGEEGLRRAHVFVSCRVSDWKGKHDLATMGTYLPVRSPSVPTDGNADWQQELLGPIFDRPARTGKPQEPEPERSPTDEPLVVRLVPLDADQQRTLAAAAGVNDLDAFMTALYRQGLEPMAERPGDLLSLADYWCSHGSFGSLETMTEYSVSQRLRERHHDRPDNDTLTDMAARHAAERLAAALVLGKTFTLRAPGDAADLYRGADTVDPADLLREWTDAQRGALLRRGIFAPATYGRVRFHHRSVQEYLAACWFRRFLDAGGNGAAVHDVLFGERYGVQSAVPSLRPVAAWLALWNQAIRDELLHRAPLALIQHGDPGSLPLPDRARLLLTAAEMHATGKIANDDMDRRALWMFADASLAPAIQQAWDINPRDDFRIDLLRLIQEGAIRACFPLARQVALDKTANVYGRCVALDVLRIGDDRETIEAFLADVMTAPAEVPARLAEETAGTLFPRYMDVAQLIRLIDLAPASKQTLGGFGQDLPNLYRACPDLETKLRFADGIARLCLTAPLVDGYYRISARHADLAQNLAPLAIELIRDIDGDPRPELVALLTAIRHARGQERAYGDVDGPSLPDVISLYPPLNGHLFRAAAEETAHEAGPGNEPIRFWQVDGAHNGTWTVGPAQLPALMQDLRDRPHLWQRRIALSAIVFIQKQAGRLTEEIEGISAAIGDVPELKADLDSYLAPPVPDPDDAARSAKRAERARLQEEQESKDKESWLRLRNSLAADPDRLRDPAAVSRWEQGAAFLANLADWLSRSSRKAVEQAVLEWRMLEPAFGMPVAEAFRDGMGILWRITAPRPPQRHEDGWVPMTRLSYAAIGIEAAEAADWAGRLTPAEALRAVEHACLSRQGCPPWIDALLQAWPDVAVPPIIKEITDEWRSASQFGRCFLGHVARTKSPRPPSLRKAVFDLVAGEEPGSVHALEEAISILLKSPLTPEESAHLSPVALNRLKQDPDDTDKALRYLALALVADPDSGVAAIERWVQAGLWCADERAELLFAHLFDPYRNRIPTSPAKLPMAGLEQLLKLVFRHIRPQDDHVHEGPPLRDRRDDAENARNAILSALMNRTGPDAHGAILRIAEDLAPDRQRRFRELAQGMAERDADPPAWAPIDILRFEQKGLWPARTGDDLMRLILGVLADIGRGLTANDASSRLALLNCPDETAVQGWLAEQLELRSRGRYSRVQEAITNRRDRIDILVRSSAAPVELSIELKRGDNWRAAELRDALLGQLREGYLLPENRRHGILFVTRHEKSSWRPTDHPSRVDFRRLIEWLSTEAAAATAADGNSRVLRVIGLDADPHDPGAASRRR